MQKSIYRKYAVTTLCLLVVAMLAACSGASSTDEELAYENGLIGNVEFDVNPSASSVTVTPVGSPWLNNPLPGDGSGNIPNVQITTSNISYGANIMDFRVAVKWTDPNNDLWNVKLEVASTTDGDVYNMNDDRCGGATPWSSCLSGASLPTITYASEVTSEGAETLALTSGSGSSSTLYINQIHAGCGKLSARWRLNETSGLAYKFWAKLYGTPAPINPLLDPRYDHFTSTVFPKVRKITYGTTSNPPEGADSSSMAANEWFYLHVYLDNPGNNVNFPHTMTETIVGGPYNGKYVGPQHIEDVVNVTAYASATNSTASYWFFDAWIPWAVRFDNTVLEIPSNETNGIAPILVGTKFQTAGGTRILMPYDPNGTTIDGWAAGSDIWTSSNRIGVVLGAGVDFAGSGALFPNPCNVSPATTCPVAKDGYANRDVDIIRMGMHVKASATSGQGSMIAPATDSKSIFQASLTNYAPYSPSNWINAPIQRSNNWPNWCELLPTSVCVTTGGAYNNERNYICVQ